MKKRTKIILIVLALILIVIPISLFIRNRIKVQNVFDEIYYDEKIAVKGKLSFPPHSLGLGRIKDVKNWDRAEALPADFPIGEDYEKEDLPKNMRSISISFAFYDGEMSITFGYQISEYVSLFFSDEYFINQKKLKNIIYIVDKTSEEANGVVEYIENKNEVQKYLNKYNIDEKKLNQYYEGGMQDILLKDWCSAYPSRFSPKDWGNVEVIKNW